MEVCGSTRVMSASVTTSAHSISDTELLAHAHLGLCVFTGYGFVDFDSPAAAQKAVASLKANGVQAQMAKVRTVFQFCFIIFFFCDRMFFHSYETKLESVTI